MARRQGAISWDPGAADRDPLKLDNPLVVRWEYASEERLAARNAAYRELVVALHGPEFARQQLGCVVGAETEASVDTAVFPDPPSMRRFVAMTITRAHVVDRVPDVEGEFRTRSAHVLFVAREPR